MFMVINNQICINNKMFLQHRIVYLIHNQNWDIYDTKQMINHKNKIRFDNRIENLEVVTQFTKFPRQRYG